MQNDTDLLIYLYLALTEGSDDTYNLWLERRLNLPSLKFAPVNPSKKRMTFDFRSSSLHTTKSFGRVSHHKLEGKRFEYLEADC